VSPIERISLGLKQTQEDPWQRIVDTYNIDDELVGKVTKVVTFGAFVEILDGVEGLVHISELAPHHVENPREIVHPGDEIRVRILEIDSERRRLSLSAKRVEDQLLPLPRPDEPAGQDGAGTEDVEAKAVPEAGDEELQALEATETPEAVEVEEAPEAPELVPKADEAAEAVEAPKAAETAEVDEVPETAEVAETPKAAETVEAVEAPEATEASEVVEAAEVAEAVEEPAEQVEPEPASAEPASGSTSASEPASESSQQD